MAARSRLLGWPGEPRRVAADLAGMAAAISLAVLAALLVSGCHWGEEPATPATSAPAVSQVAPATAAKPVPAVAVRGVPAAAMRYRPELIRCARSVWGLDAPVSTMAAQIHQESGWRADAKSPVGARGLAQFMPATSAWIGDIVPDLAANEPYNPSWAMRALAEYDKWLWDRVSAGNACHRMAFALSAYTGGLGWVRRDAKMAAGQGLSPDAWWDHVETVNAGRSAAAWKENRGYPRRILRTLEPLYIRAGFGQGVRCD